MSLEASLRLSLGAFDLDVALAASAGETLAVVGPNGAGKTTALRALAGLVALDDGRVEVDGVVLEDTEENRRVPPDRRPVAVVFQDLLLFPHLSVHDNVAFGLRARGARPRAARAAAREWLERLALSDLARARPSQLSGGQAQRVAVARALATRPGLLLLDEPLSAIDVASRRSLRRELRHMLAATATTRVLVTHDPIEAAVLGDRMAVLDGGRIVQTGTPEEVRARPRSAFVAQLADLNLMRGRARGRTVEVAAGAVIVTAREEQGEVFAAVRPEAVAVHRHQPGGSPRNAWPATVDHLEEEAGVVRVHVRGPVPLVAAITPPSARELRLSQGDTVWVAVKATEVDVYPV